MRQIKYGDKLLVKRRPKAWNSHYSDRCPIQHWGDVLKYPLIGTVVSYPERYKDYTAEIWKNGIALMIEGKVYGFTGQEDIYSIILATIPKDVTVL